MLLQKVPSSLRCWFWARNIPSILTFKSCSPRVNRTRRYEEQGGFSGFPLWPTQRQPSFYPARGMFNLHTDRDAHCAASAATPDFETRQILLPTSSATSKAPVLLIATPTGLPKAFKSVERNPVKISFGTPEGLPLVNGTKTTLYPLCGFRFHE